MASKHMLSFQTNTGRRKIKAYSRKHLRGLPAHLRKTDEDYLRLSPNAKREREQ
jgi:hypothetical protein